MFSFLKNKLHYIIPLLLLMAGLFLRVVDPSAIQQMRLLVFDNFQRQQPRDYTQVPVRIADLDDKTLEQIGQWPWSRTKVSALIAQLTNLGAAAVVFDIVFSEPDRTSPGQVLPTWASDIPELAALKEKQDQLPDPDQQLADMIGHEATRVVTGFVLNLKETPRLPKSKASFAFGGSAPLNFVPLYTGATANLTKLEESASGNGSFNMVPDLDGMVRRVPTVVGYRDETVQSDDLEDQITLYPSLHQEALRVSQGASTLITKTSSEGTGMLAIKNGRFEVPTDGNGYVWFHQSPFREDRYVPIWELFEEDFDRSKIEGHIVLIGTTAAGLLDLRPTPLNPALPGVEVHAQILEQILTDHFLERPDWATGAEITFMVLAGLILIFILPWTGALWSAILGFSALSGSFVLSWYLYSEELLLLDAIYPGIVILGIYLSSSLTLYLRSEAEKAKVREAFGMYLSPDLVEQLAEQPDKLQLGGEMKDMTLLFMDIRGFTTISEQFDAVGLTKFINRFLTPMTARVLEQKGTIDKYMGDCIMAFWNAPLDDSEHAANACRSALRMCQTRDQLNIELKEEAEREDRKYIPLNVGIGVNSGLVCVGNMGSDMRFDYSVLGDDVNLASRLEGQSKTYGVDIVIGNNTHNQLSKFACLELDLIKVKGKTEPVRIFCLLGDEIMAETSDFQTLAKSHAEMLARYREQAWDACQALIDLCREQAKGKLDKLYDLYEERMADYKVSPPGEDWDGVFTATSK